MITFEHVRQIVDDAVRPTWAAHLGTLVVGTRGLADVDGFHVPHGAAEAAELPEVYQAMDSALAFVDRISGALTWGTYLLSRERLDGTSPVDASEPWPNPAEPHPTAPTSTRITTRSGTGARPGTTPGPHCHTSIPPSASDGATTAHTMINTGRTKDRV